MATYPSHGLHLRQRHPNRRLLLAVVVVAALVGAGAWALADHYAGGTSNTTTGSVTSISTDVTGSATSVSTDVANKYVAALEKTNPSALTPILAKDAVSVDWAYCSGPPFRSAKTLERVWAGVFASSGAAHWSGSIRAAAPDWAAVSWRLRGSTNPLTSKPFTLNGLSILNVKQGKIVRETYYWDVPGRSPGIAAAVGRKFATALAAGLTPRSLYTKDAIESYVGLTPSTPNGGNLIWNRWGTPSFTPLHARLCCVGPSQRLDNGRIRSSWAVVNWMARDASPGGSKVSGVSILQLNKQGKIVRETMYYSYR